MSIKHDIHITQTPGTTRWRVSQGGTTISIHNKQAIAVDVGRREAKRSEVDLVTHGADGRILAKYSYARGSVTASDHGR